MLGRTESFGIQGFVSFPSFWHLLVALRRAVWVEVDGDTGPDGASKEDSYLRPQKTCVPRALPAARARVARGP